MQPRRLFLHHETMSSSESFPILYFNMAGEMIYIIEQRLTAQNVDTAKAGKVLNDITLAMFNPKLIGEVFKPHNTITFTILRSIFEKLAHSSIMRLNEQSMCKLFDLMVMVVKYQLYACAKPPDLLVITDNHLVSLIEMTFVYPEETIDMICNVRNQFLFYYNNRFDLIGLQLLRFSLLNFLKDIHTRVSIFLRENIQCADGRFTIVTDIVHVECECQIPGVIRYFQPLPADNQFQRFETFDTQCKYVVQDARTTLGLNIYRKELSAGVAKKGNDNENAASVDNFVSKHQNEIDLLALLICKTAGNEETQSNELKFEFLEEHADETLTEEIATDSYNLQNDLIKSNNGDINNEKFTSDKSIEPNQQHLIDIIKDLNNLDLIDEAGREDQSNTNEVDFLELIDL